MQLIDFVFLDHNLSCGCRKGLGLRLDVLSQWAQGIIGLGGHEFQIVVGGGLLMAAFSDLQFNYSFLLVVLPQSGHGRGHARVEATF